MACFQTRQKHDEKLKSLRSNRKKLKAAFKFLSQNNILTFVADKATDSLQDLSEQAETKLGVQISNEKPYILSNGIRKGFSTISEVAHLQWGGDKRYYIETLKNHGINVINADDLSPKTTINVSLVSLELCPMNW